MDRRVVMSSCRHLQREVCDVWGAYPKCKLGHIATEWAQLEVYAGGGSGEKKNEKEK